MDASIERFCDTRNGTVLIDRDLRIVEANEAFARFVGIPRERLAGEPILDALRPMIPDAAIEPRVRAALGGTPGEAALDCSIPGRGIRRFLLQFDPSGSPSAMGVVLALVDVSLASVPSRPVSAKERLIEGLLSVLPVPFFLKDADGRYVDCNIAFSLFTGLDRARIVGSLMEDLWDSDLAATYRDADLALLRKGGEQIYEADARRRDGELRRIMFYKARVDEADGTPAGLVGVMLDITELRAAQSERSRIDGRLGAFLQFVPAMALMLDRDGRVLLGNEIAGDMLGIEANAIIGKRLADIGSSALSDLLMPQVRSVYSSGEPSVVEKRIRTENGLRVMTINCFPIPGPFGSTEAVGFIGLGEAEQRVMTMFATMPHGLAWRRAEGPYMEANAAALEMLGLERGEARGKGPDRSFLDAYDREGRSVPIEDLPSEQAIRTGKPVRDRILGIRLDGKVRWVSISAIPLLGGDGKASEVFLTLDDVSELHRESSLKDEVIREIHHRVKNNLALVVSLLRITSSRAAPEARDDLDDAIARIGSIADLYDLLVQTDSFDLVDVAEYLGRLIASSRVSIGSELGITISLDAASIALPQKRVVSLGLIISELVTNAIKYAYPAGSGEIRVLFLLNGDRGELRVEDDGVGSSSLEPGTGLNIVEVLASDLGGTIRFESAGGMTCILEFPVQG
jgi:PAS domain S-box-containing protein